MITKQQLEDFLTPEPINDYSYIRFVNDLKNTESYALEKFKRKKNYLQRHQIFEDCT